MTLVLKRRDTEAIVIFPATCEPITIKVRSRNGAVKLMIDGDPRDRVLRGELIPGETTDEGTK